MRTKLRSKFTLLFMTFALVLAFPAIALADDVYNNLDTSIDAAAESITLTEGGTNDTASVLISPTNGDGKNGCNLTSSTTLKVAANSSDATKVNASLVDPTDTSLAKDTFTSCGDSIKVKVEALAATGSTPVTISLSQVSNSTAGTFNLAPATFTVAVNAATPADTTPPTIEYVLNPAAPDGSNDWYKSDVVTLTWTVTESESAASLVKTGCEDQNITADQAATTYSCSATSDGGSAGPVSVTIKLDKTAPTNVAFEGGFTAGSYQFGSVPNKPTCTADGAISGLKDCVVSGYSTAVGSHTLKATATDNAGNTATEEITYTVNPYTLNGFFQPVDMGIKGNTDLGSGSNTGSVVNNSAKAGQTVPLKFKVFNGAIELTDTSVVKSLVQQVTCGQLSGATEDIIENYATGGTSLRYDTTGGQFIFNWQTPKNAGGCYKVTMTTQDNSFITAYFTLRK